MLSIWNKTTEDNLKTVIPDDIRAIMDELPGENPSEAKKFWNGYRNIHQQKAIRVAIPVKKNRK